MISGFLGSNVQGVVDPDSCLELHGNWDKLPNSVAQFGRVPEEIFAGYYDLQEKVGADEMKNIPYVAIALWTLADKLSAGLQQLLAGARKFSLAEISRNDLFSANRETEKETQIPFMTDVLDNAAKRILDS